MVSTRTLMHGSRPLNLYSVFDFEIADYEIQGGFCQLQLDVAAHIPNGEYTVDWGDGTIDKLTHYRLGTTSRRLVVIAYASAPR